MTTITSDITGQNITYFNWANPVEHNTSIAALLTANPALANRQKLNLEAIYHLLRNGFEPFPHSVFATVGTLGIGDQLTVNGTNARIEHNVPYHLKDSRQDQIPSTKTLLNKLVASVEQGAALGDGATLFVSAGKDSTSLALAMGRSGLDKSKLDCVTFYNNEAVDEHEFAAHFCQKLGLRHNAIAIDPFQSDWRTLLEGYFKNAVQPAIDQSLLPYLACAKTALPTNRVIFDGTGNDIYFGVTAKKSFHRFDRWLPNGAPGEFIIKHLLPRRHFYSRFFTNRAEVNFGTALFWHDEITKLIPSIPDTLDSYWDNICNANANLNIMDFRAVVRLYQQDARQVMRKARFLSEATGNPYYFPFAQKDLIEYVFNLPEAARFTPDWMMNKVLLRQMLREELEYDDAQIGKRVFGFRADEFLNHHDSWIAQEVLDCGLWQQLGSRPAVVKMWEQLKRETGKPYVKTKNAKLCLYQLCAWYNHSKWLQG